MRFLLVHSFQVPLHKIDGGSASVGGVSNPLLSVKELTINKNGNGGASLDSDDDCNEKSPLTTPRAGSGTLHLSSSGPRTISNIGSKIDSAKGKKRSSNSSNARGTLIHFYK